MVLDISEALAHAIWHFPLHGIPCGFIIRPSAAAAFMGVRNVHRRRQIAIEGLQLRKCEWIIHGGQIGCRIGLRDINQRRWCFSQDTFVSDQRRHTALRIDLQKVRGLLLILGEIYPMACVFSLRLLQCDMGRERAGTGRVI